MPDPIPVDPRKPPETPAERKVSPPKVKTAKPPKPKAK